MNPVLRNILVFIGSIAIGMLVFILVNLVGSILIPPPESVVDPTNLKEAREYIKLLEPKHFITPFISHFLCSFVGGFFAAKFSKIANMGMAIGVGIFFLLAGVAGNISNGTPNWFITVDLIFAYLFPAYIAAKIALKSKKMS